MRRLNDLAALLAARRFVWIASGLGLLLSLPALGNGFLVDDRAHREFVLSHLAGEPSALPWWDLFSTCRTHAPLDVMLLVHSGFLPWWSSPQLSLALFRPLAAASHYLDYLLFPDAPALMHLHNAVLYAALVALTGMLYRRLLGPSLTAGLALLLYAVDEAHLEGTSWLASRNTLLTACFVTCALLLYDRHRRDGYRPGAWLAALALLCAHASSEGAVAAWGYLLAYALWLDQGRLSARLRPLLPLLLTTAGYLLFYRGLGYGMHGSGVYFDPLDAPLAFARAAPERWLGMLRDQLVYSDLLRSELPRALETPARALLALGFACALPLALSAARRSRPLAALLAGALLSALPLCAAPFSPRLYFLPSLGMFAVIAAAITRGAELLRADSGAARPRRALAAAGAASLVLVHAALPLALLPAASTSMARHDRTIARYLQTLPWGDELAGKNLYVVNTPHYYAVALARLYAAGPGPRGPFVLGASERAMRVSRLSRELLLLEPGGGFLADPWSQVARRRDQPFTRGARSAVGEAWVEVAALTDDGRPSSLLVWLPDPDDPRHVFVAFSEKRQRYLRLVLPSVGQWLELPGL